MMDDASKAAIQQLLDESLIRWRNQIPMIIHVPREYLWVVMTACQIVRGMDGIPEEGRQMFEKAGRRIQEYVCDSAELYTFAESGWNIREEKD